MWVPTFTSATLQILSYLPSFRLPIFSESNFAYTDTMIDTSFCSLDQRLIVKHLKGWFLILIVLTRKRGLIEGLLLSFNGAVSSKCPMLLDWNGVFGYSKTATGLIWISIVLWKISRVATGVARSLRGETCWVRSILPYNGLMYYFKNGMQKSLETGETMYKTERINCAHIRVHCSFQCSDQLRIDFCQTEDGILYNFPFAWLC